jgi:hypothetical protein
MRNVVRENATNIVGSSTRCYIEQSTLREISLLEWSVDITAIIPACLAGYKGSISLRFATN